MRRFALPPQRFNYPAGDFVDHGGHGAVERDCHRGADELGVNFGHFQSSSGALFG
jgi:hypothetical protein